MVEVTNLDTRQAFIVRVEAYGQRLVDDNVGIFDVNPNVDRPFQVEPLSYPGQYDRRDAAIQMLKQ